MMWFLPLYGSIGHCEAGKAVGLGVVLSNCAVL